LPYFGIVSEIILSSRASPCSVQEMVFATMAIAAFPPACGPTTMFTTGTVLLPFFSLLSLLIAVPTGIKFFNWIGTMWRGQLKFDVPCCSASGSSSPSSWVAHRVMLASPPSTRHPRHLLRGGPLPPGAVRTAVFAVSRFYYWYPNSPVGCCARTWASGILAHVHRFWVTFMPQYRLGLEGMPRRVATYDPGLGWQLLNQISTAGAFLIGISFVFMLVNVWVSWRKPVAAGDNPWTATLGMVRHLTPSTTTSTAPTRPFGTTGVDFHHPDAWPSPQHQRQRNGKHPNRSASFGSDNATSSGGPGAHRSLFLIGIAIFFGIVGAIYWFVSYEQGHGHAAGTTLLGLLPGSYYCGVTADEATPRGSHRRHRRGGQRIIGSFPNSSIWPFILGMGLFLIVLSLVFGPLAAHPRGRLVISLCRRHVESRRGGTV